MSQYNLNEKAGQEYFELELDDFLYKMSYPSSRDLLDVQKTSKASQDNQRKILKLESKIQSETNETKRAELETQLEKIADKTADDQEAFIDWCCKFITSENSDAPDFKKAIMSKNVKFLLAFVNIVKKEIGSE